MTGQPDDAALVQASSQVKAALRGDIARPDVRAFFDEPTFTVSYVVSDPVTRRAAIIDSVWNYDHASGRTNRASADAIVLMSAPRSSASTGSSRLTPMPTISPPRPHLKEALGGRIAISRHIKQVQAAFAEIFNEGPDFARDGSQFDRLLDDGDALSIGDIPVTCLHVPGHTPADMAFVVGDALFTGDTIFMPDYGSARADFPGGDARQLYRSVRRLLKLPEATRVFLCHDYKAPGRDAYAWESTVGAQKAANVHVHDGIGEDAFVAMRTTRDASLPMPKLIVPALQVNLRAGHLPPPEGNGVSYLKLPVDRL
ncbi:MBL fold metallo-hydrolase [Sphingomonas lutea]